MEEEKEDFADLNCIICQEIFYKPVTLYCGHSFCRDCIHKALQMKPVCATCRTPMLSNPDNLKENMTIRSLIENMPSYIRKEKLIFEQKQKEIKQNIDISQQPQLTKPVLKQFRNLLSVRLLNNKMVLFPKSEVDIKFTMELSQQDFAQICSDRQVAILQKDLGNDNDKNQKRNQIMYGVSGEIIDIKYMEKNKFRAKIKIINKLQIEKISMFSTEILQDNNIDNSQEQQQNQSQHFKFEVCEGLIWEDDLSEISEDAKKNLKELSLNILNLTEKIVNQNMMLHQFDNTTQQIQQLLGQKGFNLLLNQKHSLTLKQISEISQNLAGIYNLPQELRQRIFESDSVIERMVLLWEGLQKFDTGSTIHNVSMVFRLQGESEQMEFFNLSNGKNQILILLVLVLIVIYYFMGNNSVQMGHNNYMSMSRNGRIR